MCEAFLKEGKNCNIIVYGPTSTGKTFTMQGDIQNYTKSSQVKSMFEEVATHTTKNNENGEMKGLKRHKKTLSTNFSKTRAIYKKSLVQ